MDKIQPVKGIEAFASEQLARNTIAFEKLARELPFVENKEGNVGRTELRVEHHFSYGVYARTLYIPKDCTLSGNIHKYENLNILLKGRLRVSIDNKIEEIEAPFTTVSPPGTKRIAWALEDSIWMTIHGTHERDLKLIEKVFIAHNEQEYLEFVGHNQLALELSK